MSEDVLGLCGSTVDGIRVESCVDTGGVSLVYRGHDIARNEPVALKILRLSQVGSDLKARDALVGRFRDETKILQHLSHGTLDIARCSAHGETFSPATGEKVYYTVVEWLDGRTLAVDLEERRQRGMKGRGFGEALDLIESAALALAHAHSQGIVHRDVTPSNLFLARTRGGIRLKVLDFGVAKILADDVDHRKIGFEQSVKTMSGTSLCSPAYGAPEQYNPRLGPLGTWTDVYSLTLVLLEVILGERVRNVQTAAEGAMKALDPVTGSPRPSRLGIALPPMIDDLLARAVAQNPHERPASAGILWSSLRELTRMTAQPVRDAAALAPTAMAVEADDAILKMRAQIASAGQPPPPMDAPSAFHGTMVMQQGPGGLQQLGASAGTAPMHPPAPQGGGTSPSMHAGALAPQQFSPLASSFGGAIAPLQPPPQQRPNVGPTSDPFRPPQGGPFPAGPIAPPGAPSSPALGRHSPVPRMAPRYARPLWIAASIVAVLAVLGTVLYLVVLRSK